MKKHILLNLLILLATINLCFGQQLVYDSEVLAENIGVSGLEVEQTFMDAKGRIWIKTELALNLVYDRNNVITYGIKKSLHSNNKIKKIVNDDNGIKIYYKGEPRFYDHFDDLSNQIDSIPIRNPFVKDTFINYTITPLDDVWQLFKSPKDHKTIFNPNTKEQFELTELSSKKIIKSCASADLIYFMSKSFEIYIYNHKGVLQKTIPSPLFSSKSTVKFKQSDWILHCDNKQRLWVSYPKHRGVYLYENNKLSLYDKLPKDNLFVFVWEDKKDRLLFSSALKYRWTHDFFLIDENDKKHNWTELYDFTIFGTHVMSSDFKDHLFLSSYRGVQLLKLMPTEFRVFDVKQSKEMAGKYGHLNRGLIETKNDDIIILRENNFWFKHNTKKKVQQKIALGGKKETTTMLSKYSESRDRIYTLTVFKKIDRYKLIEFNPNSGKIKTISAKHNVINFELIDDNTIIIFAKDKKGSLFRIYYDLNKKRQISETLLSYIPKNDFSTRQLLLDKQLNRLWILERYKGLFYQDLNDTSKEIKPFTLKDSNILKSQFLDISIGGKNEIHLSTDNGFYIFDKTNGQLVRHLTREDGLKSLSVLASVYKDNYIWLSTLFGLYLYDIKKDNVTGFYTNDGLVDNEFNNRIKQLSPNGNISFGSANGALMIFPDLYFKKKRGAEIFIKNIKIQSKNLLENLDYECNEEAAINLDNFHHLDFNLYNNEWKSPQGYQYKYIINGKEYLTNSNQIRIDKLNLGSNKISIQGISNQNIPSKNILNYTIHTKLPIFKTSWFKYLMIFLFGSLILYLINLRMDSVKKEKENVQLNFQKRISQLELMALQSQMNPHFIFNAINAIQDYLWDNEKADVESYLNDFSRLMRLYLESSKTKSITLESEIEMLSLYSKLEKLRFSDKFDLEINVAENVEPKYLRLPTMLLQPFVENAINHGIFHKKGKGQIDINIIHKNKNLIISIQDDGIGRRRSKEIKNKSIYNYKSRAIQITEERINVLKEYENIEIKIDIQDLYDAQDKGIGTLVTIVIPEEN